MLFRYFYVKTMKNEYPKKSNLKIQKTSKNGQLKKNQPANGLAARRPKGSIQF